MADPVITLDKSKPYGEHRGDMTPDDPHYRVAYWQGGTMGGKKIQLPFDAQGNLIPDDGNRLPKQGINSEGKPCVYQPLYSEPMRAYLKAKLERAAKVAADAADPRAIVEDGEDQGADDLDGARSSPEDEVNLEAWLKGQARYQTFLIRQAVRKRFSRTLGSIRDIVIDLVLDEKLIPETELAPEFVKYLPAKVAA